MSLYLYNSLTRAKELFKSRDHVRMYVCGPTVYDRAHLGNARPVVVFDVLFRLLKILCKQVTYVRNITDVDDKINDACEALGISIGDLTQKTIAAYHADMASLNALPPTVEPRATDHIPHMIAMIETLIDQGHAYVANGHVLFQVSTFEAYGCLSKRDRDELLAGARVEVAPYKKNPGDFVLWKPSHGNTPGWQSPWGYGRPGWHIECSAMSATYLGHTFDIHGGGIDLIFPHHENELAQSCAAHGVSTLATVWMHNGHLTVDKEKMSKSKKNFFTVHDLLQDHQGETIRLALLMTQYRQPMDWSLMLLQQAKQTLDRFYTALSEGGEGVTEQKPDESVWQALLDDLNTPLAISALHQIANGVFKATGAEKSKLAGTLLSSARLLGLLQQEPTQWFQGKSTLTPCQIEAMIEERSKAKQEKDFKKSDQIRNDLKALGIILEDGPKGTTWRLE
jgi:cysteinyl-tRNA synthetase